MRPPEPGDGPRRAGPLGVGLAVAGAYVLVALITPRWTGRPLVPLFDGFAPPAPYAWVNPPAEFAKDKEGYANLRAKTASRARKANK